MSAPRSDRPLTILIVDDDEPVVRALSRGLEKQGHRVYGAHSAADARALLETLKLDAAVVDLVLGDEEGPDGEPAGYGLCRHISSLPDAPFVVILSGKPPEEVYEQSLRAGAVAHLLKPVTVDYLEACLQTHHRLRTEGSARPPPPFPLQIDDDKCTASYWGKPLGLERRERRALGLLLDHCDQVVSPTQIRKHVGSASDQAARKTVNLARKKLEKAEAEEHDAVIETVRSEGFIIRYRSKK